MQTPPLFTARTTNAIALESQLNSVWFYIQENLQSMTDDESTTSRTSVLSSKSTSSISYSHVSRKKKKKPAISAIHDIYGNNTSFNSISSGSGISSSSSSWQSIANKFTNDVDIVEEEKNLRKQSVTSHTNLLSSKSTSGTSYSYLSRKKTKKPAISATEDIYGIKKCYNRILSSNRATSSWPSRNSSSDHSNNHFTQPKKRYKKTIAHETDSLIDGFFGEVNYSTDTTTSNNNYDVNNHATNATTAFSNITMMKQTEVLDNKNRNKKKNTIRNKHGETKRKKMVEDSTPSSGRGLLRNFDNNNSDSDSDDATNEDGYFIWPKLSLNSSKVIQSQRNQVPLSLDDDPPEHHPSINQISLPPSANAFLREYQRDGVKWLYSRYKKNTGGVLGDEMGLGKTVQVICFIAAILGKSHTIRDEKLWKKRKHFAQKCMYKGKIPRFEKLNWLRPILVVLPASLLDQWKSEFTVWGSFDVQIGRSRKLIGEYLEMAKYGLIEILVMSYEQLRSNMEGVAQIDWCLIIFDEAHRLKSNKSSLSKKIVQLRRVKCKIALTGTPMQNDMEELWYFFNIICENALGREKDFSEFYRRPILLGRKANASKRQLGEAKKKTEMLHKLINTMMLQRKKDIIKDQLPKKDEKVVFCRMSELQQRVYKRVLSSIDYQTVLRRNEECDCANSCGTRGECCYSTVPSPIELFEQYCRRHGIDDVKYAWNSLSDEEKEPYERNGGILYPYYHPHWKSPYKASCEKCPSCLMLPCTAILTKISCHLELLKPQKKSHPKEQEFYRKVAKLAFRGEEELVGGINPLSNFMELADVEHCGKMRTLNKLIPMWQKDHHKLLIFSNYTRVLDILESFLKAKGASFLRLDGSTKSSTRLGMCDQFNSDSSIFCFLISTKAGGVGLNLTGASRVVIFDPDWNPANDLQAQDRAFRIGQKQDVRVYRLISSGSIEEMKYIRQMYKTQVNNTVLNSAIEMRYFDGVAKDVNQKGEIFGINNLWKLEPEGHMKTFLKRTSKKRKEKGMLVEDNSKASNLSSPSSTTEATRAGKHSVEENVSDPDFEIVDDIVSEKMASKKKESSEVHHNGIIDIDDTKNLESGNNDPSPSLPDKDNIGNNMSGENNNNLERTSTMDEGGGDLDTAFSSTDLYGANENEKNRVRRAREDFENGLLKEDTNGGFGLSKNINGAFPGNLSNNRNNFNDRSKMNFVNFSDAEDNADFFINENETRKPSTDLNQGAAKNIALFERKQMKQALKTRNRRKRIKSKAKPSANKDNNDEAGCILKLAAPPSKINSSILPEPTKDNSKISDVALTNSIQDLSRQFGGNISEMANYIRKRFAEKN